MKYVKDINWPLIVFVLLGGVAAVTPSFALASSSLVCAAFLAFREYMSFQHRKLDESKTEKQLKQKLSDIDQKVSDMSAFVSSQTIKQTLAANENRRLF